MSWRDHLPIHPAAEEFPLMPEAELQELGEDIKANGLRSPIVIYRGKLLDGRNRLDAMELVGIEFAFVEDRQRKLVYLACDDSNIFDGGGGSIIHLRGKGGLLDHINGDPYAFVLSANLHRRHLTGEQKRELIREDRAVGRIFAAAARGRERDLVGADLFGGRDVEAA